MRRRATTTALVLLSRTSSKQPMKLGEVFPDQRPSQPVDFHDLAALTTALILASEELAGMSGDVAASRVVREHDSDRRKRALALAARERLAGGDSHAAADTYARASISYGEALDRLAAELLTAEQVNARHEAVRVRWESLRSALSVLKTISGNI